MKVDNRLSAEEQINTSDASFFIFMANYLLIPKLYIASSLCDSLTEEGSWFVWILWNKSMSSKFQLFFSKRNYTWFHFYRVNCLCVRVFVFRMCWLVASLISIIMSSLRKNMKYAFEAHQWCILFSNSALASQSSLSWNDWLYFPTGTSEQKRNWWPCSIWVTWTDSCPDASARTGQNSITHRQRSCDR